MRVDFGPNFKQIISVDISYGFVLPDPTHSMQPSCPASYETSISQNVSAKKSTSNIFGSS